MERFEKGHIKEDYSNYSGVIMSWNLLTEVFRGTGHQGLVIVAFYTFTKSLLAPLNSKLK